MSGVFFKDGAKGVISRVTNTEVSETLSEQEASRA